MPCASVSAVFHMAGRINEIRPGSERFRRRCFSQPELVSSTESLGSDAIPTPRWRGSNAEMTATRSEGQGRDGCCRFSWPLYSSKEGPDGRNRPHQGGACAHIVHFTPQSPGRPSAVRSQVMQSGVRRFRWDIVEAGRAHSLHHPVPPDITRPTFRVWSSERQERKRQSQLSASSHTHSFARSRTDQVVCNICTALVGLPTPLQYTCKRCRKISFPPRRKARRCRFVACSAELLAAG